MQPNEFAVTDKLFEAFRTYAASDKDDGLTAANVSSESDYARMRLREELATANYSTEAGVQVLLEADPQVLKAIDVMPQAGNLVAMPNERPHRDNEIGTSPDGERRVRLEHSEI